MKIKTFGIILIILGVLMMAYTGFNYVTTEKVVDLGAIQINQKESHPVQWSPIVGVVLLAGGIIVVLGGRRLQTK